jgi:hypothetical protein
VQRHGGGKHRAARVPEQEQRMGVRHAGLVIACGGGAALLLVVDGLEQAAGNAAESGLQVHHEVEPLKTVALFSVPTNLTAHIKKEVAVGMGGAVRGGTLSSIRSSCSRLDEIMPEREAEKTEREIEDGTIA